MRLRVVLVEPMYDGNVGSVARAMKNFGFDHLVLVNPCGIDDFGRAMAVHARDVLEGARVVSTIEEAVKGADLVIGTTGKRLVNEQRHLRLHMRVPYLTPSELSEKLRGKEGEVALLLGREDVGLTNDELRSCDILVSIPTSEDYPVMNLSHAATVLFYELGKAAGGRSEVVLASGETLSRLLQTSEALLKEVKYPGHKIDYVTVMLRRVFGRAEMTEREANTLLGIIKSIRWRLAGGGCEQGSAPDATGDDTSMDLAEDASEDASDGAVETED